MENILDILYPYDSPPCWFCELRETTVVLHWATCHGVSTIRCTETRDQMGNSQRLLLVSRCVQIISGEWEVTKRAATTAWLPARWSRLRLTVSCLMSQSAGPPKCVFKEIGAKSAGVGPGLHTCVKPELHWVIFEKGLPPSGLTLCYSGGRGVS